jgi:hypothetical protein
MSDKPTFASRVIDETLSFYRATLDWLIQHHSAYAEKTSHDLGEDERHNAIWKLSGQSISQGLVLVELLDRGFTGQTWPTMRAIHEVDRLLVAVNDPEEERIARRWLADQEVKQKVARQAGQRQAMRFAEVMRAAGEDPFIENIELLSQEIYRVMSRAAHHQRLIGDEAVDHEARTMVYGSDSREHIRLEYVAFAGTLIQEVLLLVGDALITLWGPQFVEHLTPMLRRFETALDGLDTFHLLRRIGLG